MLTAGVSFLSHEKTIAAKKVRVDGKTPPFQTKFEQAIEMTPEISAAFPDAPLLVITDSWFGNDDLFKPMRKTVEQHCHMLSRLCVNTTLFALPSERQAHQLGRTRKYDHKMGNATQPWPMNSMSALPPIRFYSTVNNAMLWSLTTS